MLLINSLSILMTQVSKKQPKSTVCALNLKTIRLINSSESHSKNQWHLLISMMPVNSHHSSKQSNRIHQLREISLEVDLITSWLNLLSSLKDVRLIMNAPISDRRILHRILVSLFAHPACSMESWIKTALMVNSDSSQL